MNRIERAVEQYNNRKNQRQGVIYARDIYNILILSGKDPLKTLIISLKAGWIIGYNAAKREEKARRTRKPQ